MGGGEGGGRSLILHGLVGHWRGSMSFLGTSICFGVERLLPELPCLKVGSCDQHVPRINSK